MNEKIRAHIPVTVQLLPLDDPAVEKVEAAVFNSSYSILIVRNH